MTACCTAVQCRCVCVPVCRLTVGDFVCVVTGASNAAEWVGQWELSVLLSESCQVCQSADEREQTEGEGVCIVWGCGCWVRVCVLCGDKVCVG